MPRGSSLTGDPARDGPPASGPIQCAAVRGLPNDYFEPPLRGQDFSTSGAPPRVSAATCRGQRRLDQGFAVGLTRWVPLYEDLLLVRLIEDPPWRSRLQCHSSDDTKASVPAGS